MSQFALFKETTAQGTFEGEALRGGFAENPLSDIFLSQQNIDALQEGIRYRVYVKSGNKHVIGRQSDVDLKIVMRSVYIQHSKNKSFDILGQVRDLNAIVLDYCVNQIMGEINMYVRFRADQQSIPEPFARSENVSSAGTRQLIMKEF